MTKRALQVLLLEEKAELREATGDLLAALGHHVATARSVSQAAEWAQKRKYDLLVADAYPPDGTGIQTVRGIRRGAPRIPALLLSGFGQDTELGQAVAAEEVAVLTLPFTSEALTAEIDNCLRQRPNLPANDRLEPSPIPSAAGAERRIEGANRRRRPITWLTAALVTIAAGISYNVFRTANRASELPAPAIGDLYRGATLIATEPIGDQEEAPRRLAWQPRPGAARYRVTLRGADPEPLWESNTTEPFIPLPRQIYERLRRAVTYHWRVEALNDDRSTLGASPEISFRIRLSSQPLESVPRKKATGKE